MTFVPKHPNDCAILNGHSYCRLCWLAENDPHYQWAWKIPVGISPKAVRCRHLGADTKLVASCIEGCGKGIKLKVFSCSQYGLCTVEKRSELNGEGIPGCCKVGSNSQCPSFQPIGPIRETVMPYGSLADSWDKTQFNPSIIDWKGQRLLAYRCGRAGSVIHIARLDKDLRPGPSKQIRLNHHRSNMGRDDPRFFIHNDRLYLSYIGVTGELGPTHCLYARLNDDLDVEDILYPHYPKRHHHWEKNWVFFSRAKQLFALYTIKPHTVLLIEGDHASMFTKQEWAPRWTGGEMRGGASPVLIGDEFVHFFHGAVEAGGKTPNGIRNDRTYNLGVYCFEAKPPFRPTRYIPDPIMWADPDTRDPSFWCSALFACGAILDKDRWLVSCGIHDEKVGIYEFDAGEIERHMIPC